MAPPNSKPRLREIKKYSPPTPTLILVATAETDKAVMKVMDVEMVTIISAVQRPTFPTIQPKRKYMITPRIVRIEGVKTPRKVPNWCGLSGGPLFVVTLFDI
jgi:hypothetical protein